jgi:hypothetical protein
MQRMRSKHPKKQKVEEEIMEAFTEKDLEDMYEGEFEALQKVAEDYVAKLTPAEIKENLILLLLGNMLSRRKIFKRISLKESNERRSTDPSEQVQAEGISTPHP